MNALTRAVHGRKKPGDVPYRGDLEAAVARADAAEAELARLRLERCPGAHDGENEPVDGCCEKCCPGDKRPHHHAIGWCRVHAGTPQAHRIYDRPFLGMTPLPLQRACAPKPRLRTPLDDLGRFVLGGVIGWLLSELAFRLWLWWR